MCKVKIMPKFIVDFGDVSVDITKEVKDSSGDEQKIATALKDGFKKAAKKSKTERNW